MTETEIKLESLGNDLKALMPADGAIGAPGGVWQHVANLYAAIQSKDAKEIWRAAKDLVDLLIGDHEPLIGALDWSKLKALVVQVLTIILPLILEK